MYSMLHTQRAMKSFSPYDQLKKATNCFCRMFTMINRIVANIYSSNMVFCANVLNAFQSLFHVMLCRLCITIWFLSKTSFRPSIKSRQIGNSWSNVWSTSWIRMLICRSIHSSNMLFFSSLNASNSNIWIRNKNWFNEFVEFHHFQYFLRLFSSIKCKNYN